MSRSHLYDATVKCGRRRVFFHKAGVRKAADITTKQHKRKLLITPDAQTTRTTLRSNLQISPSTQQITEVSNSPHQTKHIYSSRTRSWPGSASQDANASPKPQVLRSQPTISSACVPKSWVNFHHLLLLPFSSSTSPLILLSSKPTRLPTSPPRLHNRHSLQQNSPGLARHNLLGCGWK